MKKLLNVSLIASVIITATNADEAVQSDEKYPSVRKVIDSFGKTQEKEVSIVDEFKGMFSDAKVTGQIRSVYAGYNQKEEGTRDTYATAIGGQLKYELAELNGFNAAFAFTTSHDIGFMTGDKKAQKHNDELSSSSGDYTQLSEAYINYKYDGFNFRAGRQVIDTPLADSDDIRMIPNTFEAYIATYEFDKFTFTAGNVQRWQGVDAGLDDGWVDTGSSGTWLGGVTYSDDIEFNGWYYDISKEQNAAKAVYIDLAYTHTINDDISLYGAVQYLKEREDKNSGVEADIYGVLAEFKAYGAGFNIAYNKSNKKDAKRSFSGIGGGTMFTSMDTMIIDEIADDRDAEALVAGLLYEYKDFSFLYAYGDFKGDANSLGERAHIVEQNIGFEYNIKDELVIAAIYVKEEDKENASKTQYDWNRMQVMIKYDF